MKSLEDDCPSTRVAEVFDRTCQFIEDFSIFLKQYYDIIV